MKMELLCIIRGKVQGVMFRDFIQRKARYLNVVGTVENKIDGSVEVIAVGEELNLQKLVKRSRKGPFLTRAKTRVDSVEVKFGEVTQNFQDFKIIY